MIPGELLPREHCGWKAEAQVSCLHARRIAGPALGIGLRSHGCIPRALASVLAVLCIAQLTCAAQRYTFGEYTEGLGNLNISCLAQDRTGYLWVGTQNGLYRYDGSRFEHYGKINGLPERMVENLFAGPDGTLWVGTTTGIFFERRDGGFQEVAPPNETGRFLPRYGTAFTANKQDEVVAATERGAFLLRHTGPDQWAAHRMNLEGGSIWSAQYARDGALWYGCGTGLCRLAEGKTTRLDAALKLPEEHWTNLLLARNGHMWVRGGVHVGELTAAGDRFELHDLPASYTAEPFPALAEDGQGRILTSQGPSLAMWEAGQWRMVTERNGLSRFELQTVFVDREASVWIGVVGHGLKRWVGQDQWEGFTAADGLSNDLVWASTRDRKGRLWIGTESGLDWIPAGGDTPRPWRETGLRTTRVDALEVSPDGAIWMGSAAGSVTRINPDTLVGVQWKVPEVYRIVTDRHRRIWVATTGGLYAVDADKAANGPKLVADAALLNVRQRFSDLSLDPEGRLWAAGDHGIFVRDGGGWHRIDPGDSGANPDLIAADHQGNLWAAGPSQNLMRLRVEGYRIAKAEQIGRPPLLSQQVVSLLVDHRGWLWLGQDAGLTVFDGGKWHSFTQDDGLIWNDTDSFALSEDGDGSLWIGTSGGISHLIDPQSVHVSPPPAPAFSHVTYGAVGLGNGSSAQWRSEPLIVSMAILSFRGMHDIAMRYRLIGPQGTGWEETRETDVRYRHLPPGNYRFEVKAVDSAGNSESPLAVFSFRITPLWWQNRYLQVGLVLLAIAIVAFSSRRKLNQLLQQKKELEEAVTLRTIDLELEKAELLRTREQMRRFAERDDLTGLWNHRIIVERLSREVDRSRREGTPLSIILVDLDDFKSINDTFGHLAGDAVLKGTSTTLQRLVRSYDWVGRYGGEEFLLVLPGSDFAGAQMRAEDLRAALEAARVEYGETQIGVTGSFGVASGFPASSESMIRAADEALYDAKSRGRNCIVARELDVSEDSAIQQEQMPG